MRLHPAGRLILTAVLLALAIASAIHDGEAPELTDLTDRTLHHEKIEAWLAILSFAVLVWPPSASAREARGQ